LQLSTIYDIDDDIYDTHSKANRNALDSVGSRSKDCTLHDHSKDIVGSIVVVFAVLIAAAVATAVAAVATAVAAVATAAALAATAASPEPAVWYQLEHQSPDQSLCCVS
jgi:hypothetical protein